MPNTFQRDRFTWLAYLILAFYTYFINILGPIAPFLKDELGLSYTVSSLHYTAFAVGILLIGLGGHLVIDRIGRWAALWVGAVGVSLGTMLLIFGKTPVLTIGATFLMGLVGSLILIIIPSALADRHGERRAVVLSEANVISSLVAAAAPLLVGIFARTASGWRMALGIVAFVPLLMYPVFRDAKPGEETFFAENGSRSHQPLPGLYWVYWLGIVLAVAAEFCMLSWSADYLRTVLGMPKADASQAVSLFLIAMIIGRMAASRLVQRISTHRLLPVSILVAIAGFLVYWLAGSALFGLIGLFLTGLGIASLYPLILSLAIGTAGTETVQASTRATLASGTAILTLPLVLGRLADAVGIHQAYSIVPLLLGGVLVLILATGNRTKAAA